MLLGLYELFFFFLKLFVILAMCSYFRLKICGVYYSDVDYFPGTLIKKIVDIVLQDTNLIICKECLMIYLWFVLSMYCLLLLH